MKWRKLGRIYVPDGRASWALSHAMIPTPLILSDQVARIYVSQADRDTVARVGFIDVSLSDPTRILAAAAEPVLDIGEPGMFDDNGVNACCILTFGQKLVLYYIGYQLHRKIPYTLFTGMAVADHPEGPFHRQSKVPVLDRSDSETFVRSAPFVMNDNGRWRMWYVGGSRWTHSNGKAFPVYSVRYLESEDGRSWPDAGVECLAPIEPEEIGFGRPFIVRSDSTYRMFYSIRAVSGYRIGFATSSDGLQWTRREDEVGIARSESGWDSEMICYAAIVQTKSDWFMFYNGNGYGRTGLGVAVLESD